MKTLNESEIVYRDFWDCPRIFIVRHRDRNYLFDCTFNDVREEYEETFNVYSFSDLTNGTLEGSWEHLSTTANSYLGRVPVHEVVFDPSKRRSIDTSIIDTLLTATGAH